MKTTPLSLLTLFPSIILLGLISCLIAGCGPSSFWPKTEIRVSTQRQSTLMAQADQAMLNGRYNDARQAYAELLAANGQGAPASIARYGLACIALITADDAAEYDQSLDLFLAWAENDPSTFYNGDPRHLVPLLKNHQKTLQELKRSKKRITICQESSQTLEKKIESLNEDYSALQERATFLETRRAALQKQLKTVEAQNRSLQQKINELEKLYEELQNARENL